MHRNGSPRIGQNEVASVGMKNGQGRRSVQPPTKTPVVGPPLKGWARQY